MMSLNRTILVGRLAADPEVRYTSNEIPVAKFALAVQRPSKNGEKEVDFINIVAWRGLAKVCGEYLKKGKPVAIEGKLQVRKYEKDGEKSVFYRSGGKQYADAGHESSSRNPPTKKRGKKKKKHSISRKSRWQKPGNNQRAPVYSSAGALPYFIKT